MTATHAHTHAHTFAVDGNPSLGVLADGQEPPDDGIIRGGAIHKEQVLVVKPCVDELLCLVQSLVETYDGRDAIVMEDREVVVRCVQRVAILYATLIVGTSKGKEFACRGRGMGGRGREEREGREGGGGREEREGEREGEGGEREGEGGERGEREGKGGRRERGGRGRGREEREGGEETSINPQATPLHQHTTPTWYDPVEVSILHLLVMFVLMHIEVAKVEEPKAHCLPDCTEAMLEGEVEHTGPVGGVPKWHIRGCGHDKCTMDLLR